MSKSILGGEHFGIKIPLIQNLKKSQKIPADFKYQKCSIELEAENFSDGFVFTTLFVKNLFRIQFCTVIGLRFYIALNSRLSGKFDS